MAEGSIGQVSIEIVGDATKFANTVPTDAKAAKTAAEDLNRSMQNIGKSMANAAGGSTRATKAMVAGMRGAGDEAWKAGTTVGALRQSVSNLLKLSTSIPKVGKGFASIGTFVNAAKAQVGSLTTTIAQKFQGVGTTIGNAFSTASSTVRTALQPVASTVSGVASRVAEPFKSVASNIGTALSPITSKVSSAFRGLPGTVSSAASSMTSGFVNAIQGIPAAAAKAGRAIADGIGAGIEAASKVAAAGMVGLGAAIGGGFGRLTSLDEAIARMKGLGFAAADIEKAMNIANDAAMGTSFAMNDMANAAAMAMTNGIQPGKEMVSYLDSIKGAATASGAPLSELSSIFGKLTQNTTAGMAVTAELTQLADRQIPIWQSLSKTMGLPLEEVRKLASEGGISMQDIEAAVLDATGGMAKAMGETLPAKIKNTGSAFSRLGMALLGTRMEGDALVGGLYEPLKSFFDMLRNGIDAVTVVIAPFMQRVTDAFGGKAGELFTSLADKFAAFTSKVKEGGLDSLTGQASGLMSALGPLTGAFLALGAGGLGPLLSKVPVLGELLGALGGKFAFLASPLGIAGAALAGFLATGADASGLADGITGMVDSVVAALPGLIDKAVEIIPEFVDSILSALPELLEAGTQIINSLVQGLVVALPLLIEGVIQLLNGLITTIMQNLPRIIQAGVDLLMALLNGIITSLPLIIEGVLQLITALIDAIVQNLPLIIQAGVDLLMALIQGIVDSLPLIVEASMQMLQAILTAIVDNLPKIVEAAYQLVITLANAFIDNLPEIISATIEIIMAIFDAVMNNLGTIIEAAFEIMIALATALIDNIPELIGKIPEIFIAIVKAFAEQDWLKIGADLIAGIWEGFKSGISGFIDGIANFANDVMTNIGNFFHIGSPSKRMRDEIGRWLPPGIAEGVEDTADVAVDSVRSLAQSTMDAAASPLADVAKMARSVPGNLASVAGNALSNMPTMSANAIQNLNVGGAASPQSGAGSVSIGSIEINMNVSPDAPQMDMKALVRELAGEMNRQIRSGSRPL